MISASVPEIFKLPVPLEVITAPPTGIADNVPFETVNSVLAKSSSASVALMLEIGNAVSSDVVRLSGTVFIGASLIDVTFIVTVSESVNIGAPVSVVRIVKVSTPLN